MRTRLVLGVALLAFSLFAATKAAKELRGPQSNADPSSVQVHIQSVKSPQEPTQARHEVSSHLTEELLRSEHD